MSEASIRAQAKYDKAHRDNYKTFSLKFNKTGDADIIAKLESVTSKQTYIKDLIRKDIEGGT